MSVTVIGDAFVDIIVPVKDIRPGEAYYKKIAILCGGTANVAVQIAKLGGSSKFVGCIGNDPFGEYFRQNLQGNGVRGLIFVDDENPTGLCISMAYDDGEKAMVANRGANDFLKSENIDAYLNEIINSNIIYFSGYSLLSQQSAEAVLSVIKKCYTRNCEIYFNPGAANLIKENFKEIIKEFVDVLIVNMDEAMKLTGKSNIREILDFLGDFVNLLVITLSGNGCIVSNGKRYKQVKTEKLVFSDTTGAGDAFAAGFIVGRLRGMNEIDCAKLGNESALRFLKEKDTLL